MFIDWERLRTLEDTYAGARLADRFEITERAVLGGTVRVINQPSTVTPPWLPSAELASAAIACRLDVVRGIGPIRSVRLWQGGVRHIEELAEHYPSRGAEVKEVLVELGGIAEGEAAALIERLRFKLGGAGHLLATVLAGSVGLEEIAFLDVETLGLDNNPIFLVGVGRFREGAFVVEQHFAPAVSHEPAMLASAAEALSGSRLLVSYNGRSADVRWLAQRCLYHGVPSFCDLAHLDLLYATKRRWQRDEDFLLSARLAAVQVELLGLSRPEHDVSSDLIPFIYRRYSASPTAEGMLVPVIEHNRSDIEALPLLLGRCCAAALESVGLAAVAEAG